MPRTHSESEILEANATFYRAFSHGDFAAMTELWAEHVPVTCIHPVSAVLVGRRAVLESWRAILRERPPFELRCVRPVVHDLGAEVVIVTCYEGNGNHPAHLAATNVFALENGRWRMVHHQAGPLSSPIPTPEAPSALN